MLLLLGYNPAFKLKTYTHSFVNIIKLSLLSSDLRLFCASMRNDRLYRLLESNPIVVPFILVIVIIIFGGIGVYLAEHKHLGANITNLGDAFWWAVETITTVGYGDYTPVTTIGRIIAIFVMFSGIGIVLTLVGNLLPEKIAAIRIKV